MAWPVVLQKLGDQEQHSLRNHIGITVALICLVVIVNGTASRIYQNSMGHIVSCYHLPEMSKGNISLLHE